MTAGNTKIYLNGRFVSEQDATVSVFDRCFLYGDGIFEGIAVWGRAPFRLQPHLDRMEMGSTICASPIRMTMMPGRR
jgi:branched-chain amino acid aminotransferase